MVLPFPAYVFLIWWHAINSRAQLQINHREPRAYWQPELSKALPTPLFMNQEVRLDYGNLEDIIFHVSCTNAASTSITLTSRYPIWAPDCEPPLDGLAIYTDRMMPPVLAYYASAQWLNTQILQSEQFLTPVHSNIVDNEEGWWISSKCPIDWTIDQLLQKSPNEEAERRWHLKTNCMISKAILSLISRSRTICLPSLRRSNPNLSHTDWPLLYPISDLKME